MQFNRHNSLLCGLISVQIFKISVEKNIHKQKKIVILNMVLIARSLWRFGRISTQTKTEKQGCQSLINVQEKRTGHKKG